MSIVINSKNKDHFVVNDNILYALQTEAEICSYASEKLKEYYYQSLLYASDAVLMSFKQFLIESNRANYILTAQKMRRSLWGYKTKLTTVDLDF